MEKPTVKIIEGQEIENNLPIDNWEAEQLFRKYGYNSQQYSSSEKNINNDSNLTFEEMIAKHEEKIKKEKLKREKLSKINSKNRYNSEIKYAQDEESRFNFKIEINSDMKLPK